MGIIDKMNAKKEQKEVVVEKPQPQPQSNIPIDFTQDELEFIIRLIGSSNFKGNDLMFIYELVNKLQNLYLNKKGVQ